MSIWIAYVTGKISRKTTRTCRSLFIILTLCAAPTTIVEAHLLNAYEMAIGKWNLRLRRRDRPDIMDSILFPPAEAAPSSPEMNASLPVQQKLPSSFGRTGTMQCTLSLDPDGTFALTPPPDDDNDVTGQLALQRLPIRGEWFLTPNPYCVTDRQYDELYLISYPRVKQIKTFDRQYAILEIRCKLWGRYGMKSVRDAVGHEHGRCMGRITHGTVLLIRRELHGDVDLRRTVYHVPWWRRKIMCGTFSAQPIESDSEAGSPVISSHDDDDEAYEEGDDFYGGVEDDCVYN